LLVFCAVFGAFSVLLFFFPVWRHFDYSPSAKHVRRSATASSVFVFFTPVFTPVRPVPASPPGGVSLPHPPLPPLSLVFLWNSIIFIFILFYFFQM
jgi:hypothetical protein